MFKDPQKRAAYNQEYEKRNRSVRNEYRRLRHAQDRDKANGYQLAYYRRNRDAILANRRRWEAEHREQRLAVRRAYRERMRERVLAQRKASYERRKGTPAYQEAKRRAGLRYSAKLRAEILAAYGGICGCCAESREEFLSIDHIHGRGTHHRREVGTGLYQLLKKLGFPKDKYRLLCMNCNFSIGMRGYCPHERERQAA